MPTEEEVYKAHAEQYDRLVQCEDYQGNILPAIEEIIVLEGLDVVELGAGTGRLTRLLAPRVATIQAFDASGEMLKVARASLRKMGVSNWKASVADHRQIPRGDASADLVISGWSFGYLAVWGDKKWRTELERGLSEILRILRPGGKVILLETQGTGYTSPAPPDHLNDYFSWLEERGFQSKWIRTDYKFKSVYEARELVKFFFGNELAEEIGSVFFETLPECTGLWWRDR